MKKFFLFSILSTVLFISCSNLHFNDSTSVSIYLPELNGNTNNQNARSIEFPAGYDASVYYYEVNLNLRGTTKYKQISPGGTTITFSGIQPGDYEVECKACVKKGFDLIVFAQKLKEVTALRGRLTVVDLALNGVPVIKQQLVPHIFNFSVNDGVSFSVIQDTLPESYEVEWFIDGKPYTNFNLPEKDFSFERKDDNNPNNSSDIITFSLTGYKNGSNPGLPFGPHSLYAKITDKANGSFVRTDVVDIYFGGNEYNITPTKLDVKFKGADNTYPLEKTLSLADFSGTVTYSVSYNQTPVGNITIHYDSFPENGELSISQFPSVGKISMTGNQNDPGLQEYTFTISNGNSPVLTTVKIKRTFEFPVLDYSIEPNDVGYTTSLNYVLPTAYEQVYIYGEYSISPADVKWYSCDADGNNKVYIPQEEGTIDLLNYELPDKMGYETYYFICEITYNFDGTYCSNIPSGRNKMWSKVLTVIYSRI